MAAEQRGPGGRDWLRELAESPEPSTLPTPAPAAATPTAPGGAPLPLAVELSMLRQEVAELRSLMLRPPPAPTGMDDAVAELRRDIAALGAQLREPRKEDGAGVLTASALIELQAEVGRLHDDLPLDTSTRLDELEAAMERLSQQVLAIAQGMRALAHADTAGPIEAAVHAALDEMHASFTAAMQQLTNEIARLRAGLLGG